MLVNRFLVSIILLALSLHGSELKERSDAVIYSIFGDNAEMKFVKWEIPSTKKFDIEKQTGQRFFKDFIYSYIITKEDSLAGVAFVDNVYGKSMPITFITVFDDKGSIIKSEILKYREQYGGGVSDSNWNRQFEGKNSNSSYEIGADIQGITGATISVQSVSKGIKKLALLFPIFKSSL